MSLGGWEGGVKGWGNKGRIWEELYFENNSSNNNN